jgi:hypothetical protein
VRTLAFGGTFKIPKTLDVDAKGRVTSAEAITLTLPAASRGITQLTGDVTAPSTTNGSAAATLAASGVTAGSYGDGGAARTLAFGGTFKIPKTLNVDAKGRVTSAEAITLTVPATTSTASAAGLMSAADKTKLNGVVLPIFETTETAAEQTSKITANKDALVFFPETA